MTHFLCLQTLNDKQFKGRHKRSSWHKSCYQAPLSLHLCRVRRNCGFPVKHARRWLTKKLMKMALKLSKDLLCIPFMMPETVTVVITSLIHFEHKSCNNAYACVLLHIVWRNFPVKWPIISHCHIYIYIYDVEFYSFNYLLFVL